MFFNFFATPTRYTVVFDIANGSVGAACVALNKKKSPSILFSTRIPLPYETGEREVLPGLADALTKASTAIRDALPHTFPVGEKFDIRVFMHAPWCATTTERVPLPFAREATVTKKILQTMLAHVLQDVEPAGTRCIDRTVLQIALNGYVVQNPIGKRAKSAHVTIARSFIEHRIDELIQKILTEHFSAHTIEIDAFVFSLLQYKALWSTYTDATLIDIGGLYTALTIVRGGAIVETHTIPIGHRVIQNALTGLYNDAAHVDSQLQLYFNNAATPSQAQKIESALTAQEGGVIRAFGDGLTQLVQRHGKIPSRAIISVGTSLTPWIENVLTKIDFAQFTTTAKPFEVLRMHALVAPQETTNPSDIMLSLAVHLLAAE